MELAPSFCIEQIDLKVQIAPEARFIRQTVGRVMRTFILLALLCNSVFAADPTNSVNGYKHLVEVSFAADDRPPHQMFHEVDILWISEKYIGADRDYYSWADHGSFGPDTSTSEKAAKCRKLLKTIDEPKQLPDSPNKIVTVKYTDGDKTIVKKFPIDAVPSEIHQTLSIMGFPDSAFDRLKFVKSHRSRRLPARNKIMEALQQAEYHKLIYRELGSMRTGTMTSTQYG